MSETKTTCPQNFKVWVAFLMGMVVIVVAVIVFDKVFGTGRPTDVPGNPKATDSPSATISQTASYLSLNRSENNASVWLGIQAADLTKATIEKLGYDIAGGVLISKVIKTSPAQMAGLQRGDIIYEIDSRDVLSVRELVSLLGTLSPNERVKVAYFRGDDRYAAYVTLAEAAETMSTGKIKQIAGEAIPNEQKWGIVVSELTETLRKTFEIPKKEKGILIAMVVAGSAANRAGLRQGDLVQQVDRSLVEDLTNFFRALQSSPNHVLLKIYRQGESLFIHVIAASPFMPTGGPSSDEDDDDDEGLKGKPIQIPPYGQPETAAFLPARGNSVAQEGIGMNRPLYVPGYDQTQSGEPDDKTKSNSQAIAQASAAMTAAVDTGTTDDAPVCKRLQEIDSLL